MTLPDPNLIAAWAQAIAKVLTPFVLLGTVIFAVHAPRPGQGEP